MLGVGESWVTLVTDERTGWEALILAKSLKRLFTTKKLTVLCDDKKISKEMKELLKQEYHLVESIDNTGVVHCGRDPPENSVSKILLWGLLVWDKCVFLAPGTLVLESVEELFDLEEFSSVAVDSQGSEIPSLDIFIYKPKRETLRSLCDLAINNKAGDDVILKHFWQKWSNESTNRVKKDLWLPVSQTELHLHQPRPKIVRFDSKPNGILPTSPGTDFNNTYTSVWNEIYKKDLLPQLQKQTKLRNFIKTSTESFCLPLDSSPTIPKLRKFDDLEDAVAIVGMSCRFPGANSVEEYWELLSEGRYVVRPFPEGRRTFDIPDIYNLIAGFLSCPIDEFDAKFFGISPREAPLVDPQQRLLLEVIWESLEDAGLNGAELKDTATGVFVGILLQDYDRMLPKNGYIGNEYHHRFLGNALSANIGRISHFMGFTGPNVALESGCSSSLGALHLGCQSLRSRESNLVITGGVNLVIVPRYYNAAVVAGDFKCKAFDEGADGFVSAEGVATLVLKRYADALNDGDNIRAIIRGSAMGNDGASISFGTPNAKAQARVCKEALVNAKVQPSEVSYVEAHGTGTMLGDITEVAALGDVYTAERETPLFIGSVKTNIGHGESSAAIASIFKLILALHRESIPRNLFFEKVNPKVRLDIIPAKVPIEQTPWTGPHRIGAASSFSMTGTLVHVLLESTPIEFSNIPPKINLNIPQLITISAKSIEALEAQKKSYLHFFKNNIDLSLEDVAYATNMCRTPLQHRIAVMATDMSDLIKNIENENIMSGKITSTSNSKQPTIGFLFTGQASQYFGMAKGMYELFKPFQITLDYVEPMYQELLGVSLKDVLWHDEELIKKTVYSQPAIFSVQVALVNLWKHFGITPGIVLGHSFGAYAAAVCAGVMNIYDGLKLVSGRSKLIEKLPPGRMTVINVSSTQAKDLLDELFKSTGQKLDIAAINSPREVVVSGSPEGIEAFETICVTKSIKLHRLAVSHAFHSSHIDEILDEFGTLADKITYNEPKCTYICSTQERKMSQDNFHSGYWQCHLRETVQFASSIKLLTSMTPTLIEIGTQPVLLALSMANVTFPEQLVTCPSARKTEMNWITFYTSLSKLFMNGYHIDWSLWFGRRMKNLSLPLYCFQRQKYWFVLSDYTDEGDDQEREGLHFKTKRVHPILGYRVPTPYRIVFAQSKLTRELPYLNDCRLGGDVFLTPGVVIEILLAAANQDAILATNSTKSILAIRNIRFHEPILLNSQCCIQTTIELVQGHNKEREIKLFKQNLSEFESDWMKYGTARISTIQECTKEELDFINNLDFDAITELEKLPNSLTMYSSQSGDVEYGINYRRITGAWGIEDGKILTKLSTAVQDPEIIGSYSYICFPTILDAMIQTSRFIQSNSNKLSLPTKISKFTWWPKDVESKKLWCVGDSQKIYLVTSDHFILAKVEGIDFTGESDIELLQSSPDRQLNNELQPITNEPQIETNSNLILNSSVTDIDEANSKNDSNVAELKKPEEILEENDILSPIAKTDEEISMSHTEPKVSEKSDSIDMEEEENIIGKSLELILKQVLRIPQSEQIELDQNFTELGVDSLMSLEIGTRIQAICPGIEMSPTVVQEYTTIRSLLAHIELLRK